MIQEEITVANVSCQGCVKAITRTLSALEGVHDVKVTIETGAVTATHIEMLSREQIVHALSSIGYPEVAKNKA